MNLKLLIEYACASLIVFVLLFSPPIISEVNVVLFLFIASTVYLGVRYWRNPRGFIELAKKSGLLHFSVLFVAALMVLFAAMARNILGDTGLEDSSPYILISYRLFLILPVITITILGLIDYAKLKGWNFIKLAKIILFAFLIQILIGFVALTFPHVKSILVEVMQTNTGSDVFNNSFEVSRRFYGFANSLLDSFGYALGVAAILSIYVAYATKSYLYLIFVPLLFGMAILNARTGVVIMGIGMISGILLSIYYAIKNPSKIKSWISWKNVVATLATIAACVAVFVALEARSPVAVSSTVRSISNNANYVVSGGSSKVEKPPLMQSGFWNLPNDIGTLVFGSGHSVFGVKGYEHSDVGYINDVWAFGILGAVLLYGSILYPILSVWRDGRYRFAIKILAIFLALAFMAFLFKGRAIMANSGFILTLLLLSSIHLLEINKKTPVGDRSSATRSS